MRPLRSLALAFCLGFAAASAAVAQDRGLAARLVGTWREYSPTDNLVSFSKAGEWRLYLRKGEIQNLKSLDGRWSVSDPAGTLAIVLMLGGKEKPMPPAKLSFEGEEMILTDEAGKQTRHRRHRGPLPAEFSW